MTADQLMRLRKLRSQSSYRIITLGLISIRTNRSDRGMPGTSEIRVVGGEINMGRVAARIPFLIRR